MNDLPSMIAQAIDTYRAEHPNVMVSEVLAALEHVKFEVTDAWIRHTDEK